MSLDLMARKRGMMHIFDENGHLIPCTVLEMEKNVLTAIMTKEKNGYNAVQLGFEQCSPKRVSKPLQGHFLKNNIQPRRHLAETRLDNIENYQIGQEFGVEQFENVNYADVTAVSIGKGFAGTIKRWNFSGGRATHGVSRAHRVSGSTGQRSTPGRTFPGKKMEGHMGHEKCTVQNLKVMQIVKEDNIILVKGAVPGPKNGLVTIAKAVKIN